MCLVRSSFFHCFMLFSYGYTYFFISLYSSLVRYFFMTYVVR